MIESSQMNGLSEQRSDIMGTIRKRGDKWSYRVDLGAVNGKRVQKEKGGFSTKKERLPQ